MSRLTKHVHDKAEKRTGLIHFTLSALVILVLVARLIRRDYYAVFLCVLTLLLFNIPVFVDRKLKIKLPNALEVIILLFVFSAEILGEIGSFYTYIAWWDTMLHTINGFLMAAIGFSLIDILNNNPRFHISLSPVFVAVVAFCFSMTIGVVWEFFEFGMDQLALTDMQKDSIVTSVSSVELNPKGVNTEVVIKDITSTTIHYNTNGKLAEYEIQGGYLDVGIVDTMHDLVVNCIGAFVFSLFGYFYILGRNRGGFISHFIPRLKTKEEILKDELQK